VRWMDSLSTPTTGVRRTLCCSTTAAFFTLSSELSRRTRSERSTSVILRHPTIRQARAQRTLRSGCKCLRSFDRWDVRAACLQQPLIRNLIFRMYYILCFPRPRLIFCLFSLCTHIDQGWGIEYLNEKQERQSQRRQKLQWSRG
jgi:hypothetical protein